jgi:hypothetical protein
MLWRLVRWGTFSCAVGALLASNPTPLITGGWIATAFAFWSLVAGRQRVVEFLEAFGLRDPIQSLVLIVLGVLYWASASAGLAVVAMWSKSFLPEFIAILAMVFGVMSFTSTGSVATFGPEPDPAPWK